MKRLVALCALVVFVLALAPTAFGAAAKAKDTFVQLLAINDFHGNLQPPSGSSGRIADGARRATVNAGGVEYLATWIKALRTTNPNTITVGAGDLIGASPLISGLFHDEPTIEAMNALGLDVTGVGNHEFDEGIDELLRMQFGNQLGGNGCHPVDGCQDGTPFGGSLFQYLAANVFYERHQEHDPPAVRDPQGRQREDRVHRPHARRHAADRDAGRRRGAGVPARGSDHQQPRRQAAG